jgi:hypothetical protein
MWSSVHRALRTCVTLHIFGIRWTDVPGYRPQGYLHHCP